VVVHLYYYDLLEEILQSLRNIVEPFDLFITTPHEADVAKIVNTCSSLAASVTVRLSENKGRDIGPFMVLLLEGKLDGYLAILKLHSKKSTYSDLGGEWRKKLYDSLMGTSFLVRKVISYFETGAVGIIGPHDFYLSDEQFWGANRETVKCILIGADALNGREDPKLGFFAGSMFWFNPRALKALQSLPEGIIQFEAENGMQDGTIAHALERVFCPIARAAGYLTTSVPLKGGVEIDSTETERNRVPVL
jgi:rhamnosyltransferase